MSENRILSRELWESLPPEWPEPLLPAIQEQVHHSGRKIVVLDDDPTGTQTVHHVPVLTEWPAERLEVELSGESPVVFLLTNTRSLPLDEAQAVNAEIGGRLRDAGRKQSISFAVISRSDSTLRGHFPGEVKALAAALGEDFDAWLIVPFFPEGGRFTANDIHYVAEGEWLVPSGQTEFARDRSFGYQSSNLRDWIEEKTGGKISSGEVASISLEELRQGGPDAVERKLLSLPRGTICVANAANDRDLEVLVLGLLRAEQRGRRYLYRTAASFVRVRAGIQRQPLLTGEDLGLTGEGAGFMIAGSYVPRTSEQISRLLARSDIEAVEVQADLLLDEAIRSREIERARQEVNRGLSGRRDTLLYTSRKLISSEGGAEANLAIGSVISASLVDIVRGLETRPRYLLAKGGVTSSDIATRGLNIQRAMVLGQILPGVPVWQCGPESRFPGMPYIVFPGNVGGEDALESVLKTLKVQE